MRIASRRLNAGSFVIRAITNLVAKTVRQILRKRLLRHEPRPHRAKSKPANSSLTGIPRKTPRSVVLNRGRSVADVMIHVPDIDTIVLICEAYPEDGARVNFRNLRHDVCIAMPSGCCLQSRDGWTCLRFPRCVERENSRYRTCAGTRRPG